MIKKLWHDEFKKFIFVCGNINFFLYLTTARTDSPDNDSAFSDNVSMLSSESSASSGASGSGPSRNDPNRHLTQVLYSFSIYYKILYNENINLFNLS